VAKEVEYDGRHGSFEFTMDGWREQMERLNTLRENQPTEGILGCFVHFPIADGAAVYEVVKAKPLTLMHIPEGDAWQIPAAHMRGLTAADIERTLEFDRSWKRMAAASRGG